jgi:thiol-disulfide isomerase/thioredoxin
MPAVEVKVFSAPWCKRCNELKPEITTVCAATGVALTQVNVDEWDEDDMAAADIRSLPTIRMRVGEEAWVDYTAHTFAAWKEAVVATVSAAPSGDEDF